jgi:hypothetical protein
LVGVLVVVLPEKIVDSADSRNLLQRMPVACERARAATDSTMEGLETRAEDQGIVRMTPSIGYKDVVMLGTTRRAT